jgi:hypothetical protein
VRSQRTLVLNHRQGCGRKRLPVTFFSDCTANKDIPDMGGDVIPADVAKKGSFYVLAPAFCRVIDLEFDH